MTRWNTIAFLGYALACAILASVIMVRPARSHQAPTGWSYPLSCCSGMDCGEVRGSLIEELPAGYRITLSPGDHQMILALTVYEVAYGDPRIKDAPDGVYHVCVGQQFASASGPPTGGRLICFFVPPKGF